MVPRAVVAAILLSAPACFAASPVLSLSFEANRGQASPEVRYLARNASQTIAFTDHEVKLPCSIDGRPVALRVGGDALHAEQPTGGVVNYYLGKDRSQAIEGVPLQERIRYTNVAPGVDLIFHGETGRLEYDIEVAPHADPSAFALHASAGASFELEQNGTASLSTSCDSLRLLKPVAFQQIDGRRVEVKSSFRVAVGGALTIDVSDYDRNRPLIVDPVVSYTKSIADNQRNSITGIRTNAQGEVFIAGLVEVNGTVPTYPITSDGKASAGGLFLTKLDASGSKILYSTYVGNAGGSDSHFGDMMGMDAQGSVYVIGTGGADALYFPVTSDLGSCTGCSSSFVAKFGDTGQLVYATFLGHWGVNAMTLGADGSVYVAGQAFDNNLTTVSAYQDTFKGSPFCTSCGEGYFGKLNPQGTAWEYASYLGQDDAYPKVRAMTVDAQGNLYLAGSGYVPDENPLQTGYGTAVIAEFSADGKSLLWGTPIGGSNATVNFLSVGADGTVYLAGASADGFPYTVEAARHPVFPIGNADSVTTNAFGAAINSAHTAYVWATYLAIGTVNKGVADSSGNLYLVGQYFQDTLAYKNEVARGPASNGFIVELDKQGGVLNSTSFGGTNVIEVPSAIDLDSSGNIYIAGEPVRIMPGPPSDPTDVILDSVNVGTSAWGQQNILDSIPPTVADGVFIAKIAPQAAPQISLSWTKDYFALRNVGSADLHLNSIQGSVSPESGMTSLDNNCNGTVSPGNTCYFAGGNSKIITINSDATPAVQTYTSSYPRSYQGLILSSGVGGNLYVSTLNFPATQNGSISQPQQVVLTNLGSPLPLLGFQVSGVAGQTNNCPSTLASLGSCTLQITVSPVSNTLDEFQRGVVTISYGLASAPSSKSIYMQVHSNPGDGPLVLSEDAFGYGVLTVGKTSLVQAVTVTNGGATAVTVAAPALSGAGASSFAVSGNTCAAAPLQPHQSCSIGVLFAPPSAGTKFAALTINGGGSSVNTYLNGTAITTVALTIAPTPLSFGGLPPGFSKQQQVQLQNQTSSAITLSSIETTLADGSVGDFSQQNDCNGALAPGASCNLTITFTPQNVGIRNGIATIVLNGGVNTQTIGLQAAGITVFISDPASVNTGSSPLNATATAQLTLTNHVATAQAFTILPPAAPFSVVSTTCVSPLGGNRSCTVIVGFTPTSSFQQNGNLQVTFANSPAPLNIALSGFGNFPQLALSKTSLDFGTVVVAGHSSGTILLSNIGEDLLKNLSLSVGGSSDFTEISDCTGHLAPGASCTAAIDFTPATIGDKSGTLTIQGNMINGTQTVILSGRGGLPGFSLSGPVTPAIAAYGGAATYTLGLQPDPGLAGQATLSCSGLPQYASCSFSPSALSLTGAPVASTLTVTTSQTQTASNSLPFSTVMFATLCLVPLLRRRTRGLIAALVVGVLLGTGGCSGGTGNSGSSSGGASQPIVHKTAPGTYTFTVTATNGTITKNVTLTLTISSS